jgi:CheY-like chemotaxis protein
MAVDDVAVTNGRRILVVDDEPSIVDAVATALRYEGFEVEEATTGHQALEALGRTDPDLIVLDWMLPDIEASTQPYISGACGQDAIGRAQATGRDLSIDRRGWKGPLWRAETCSVRDQ